MTKQSTKWLQAMMKAYDTDEAGVSEIMRQRQRKSMENPNRQKGRHHGGFNDKELAREAGKKGLQSRWGYTPSSQD